MKKLWSAMAFSLAVACSSYVVPATALPLTGLDVGNRNSDLALARQGPSGGGKHASRGMRGSAHARAPGLRSSNMTNAGHGSKPSARHVSKKSYVKKSYVANGDRKVTHRQASAYRSKSGDRHVNSSSRKTNVKTASNWHVRNWHNRNHYGRWVGGVSLGTIIFVTAAPLAPAPDLCWYWADYSYNRGYWDYCYY